MVNKAIDFGVCRLAAIPLMQSPGWTSVQLTQLLFGEHYVVLDRSASGWIRVHAPVVEMEGWMNADHHHPIEHAYYEQILQSDFRITTDIASTLLYRKSPMTIGIGSIVPLSAGELFKVEEQLAFNGEAKALSQRRDGEFICTIATRFLNVPERPGGRTPFGMDADAWIRLVFRIAGYPIGIVPIEQAGKQVEPADALPGDVVVVASGKQMRSGILLNGSRVIHCSGCVKIEMLTDGVLQEIPARKTPWKMSEVRRIRL